MPTNVNTGTAKLLAQRDGHVLTLTFNHPHRMNTISGTMLAALSRQLGSLHRIGLHGQADREGCFTYGGEV